MARPGAPSTGGLLDVGYFRDKYGVDIRETFRAAFAQLQGDGWLTVGAESIDCTRDGLIQIDRHLPAFFDPQINGCLGVSFNSPSLTPEQVRTVADECRRQSRLLRDDPQEREVLDWLAAAADHEGWR